MEKGILVVVAVEGGVIRAGKVCIFIVSQVLSGCYIRWIKYVAPEARRELLKRNYQGHFLVNIKKIFKKSKLLNNSVHFLVGCNL